MPYKMFKTGSRWGVYKVDEKGRKTGKAVGLHPSRTKAKKQLAALAINVEETMDVQTEVKTEEVYPVYDMLDKSDVPWGAMTFADVEQAEQAEELMERLEERTSQFYALFWRIWNAEQIPITEKVTAWQNLFSEFTQVFQAEIATEDAAMAELESLTETLTGSIIRVSESDKQDGTARQPLTMDVAIIEPGWGNPKDNHYYPDVMLRRDAAAVFEGAKMYTTDHRQEEKSVRTEVAKIKRVIGFTETGAPIGRCVIWNPDFAEDVRNRSAVDELAELKVSILAKGKTVKGVIDGRDANIVEAMIPSRYTNVDFVTSAGAGGRALQLVESDEEVTMPEEIETVETTEVQEAEEVILHENDDQETEVVAAEVEPTFLSETEVSEILDQAKLPKISIARLASIPYLSEAVLQSAITAEKEYIAVLIESGKPKDLGQTTTVVVRLTEAELLEDHQKRIDAAIFG